MEVSSVNAGRHWLHTSFRPLWFRISKSLRFMVRPLGKKNEGEGREDERVRETERDKRMKTIRQEGEGGEEREEEMRIE